ncbi:hypothetical protein KSF_071420 [Reticulibacter mediterranei]|uniref:Uncharacterized protein n=1 Tax=Reticulibacter mediterranei TaxID=2778369 RepID=A0A8J3IK78_9CHLR|nr:hypothetical protein [Reticulibacter mediterranei]GHO97094.1 hypothetical protein KSF_071420 [Reticulibacter mediterranei]
MNQLDTAMGVAMALKYLREKLNERKLAMGTQTRQTFMQLSIQIIGRLLMTVGIEIQITGKRLVKLGQSGAGY